MTSAFKKKWWQFQLVVTSSCSEYPVTQQFSMLAGSLQKAMAPNWVSKTFLIQFHSPPQKGDTACAWKGHPIFSTVRRTFYYKAMKGRRFSNSSTQSRTKSKGNLSSWMTRKPTKMNKKHHEAVTKRPNYIASYDLKVWFFFFIHTFLSLKILLQILTRERWFYYMLLSQVVCDVEVF